MDASKLDMEKFRKVRSLIERGGTEGEKSAARNKAEVLAKKAGLTLEEALRADDADQRKNASAGSGTSQWQANEAQKKRNEEDREKRAQKRFEEAEKMYGPYEDAFRETDIEIRLNIALQAHAVFRKFTGSDEEYIHGYHGWERGDLSASIVDALHFAHPVPKDIPGAWKEHIYWDNLSAKRYAYDEYYEHPVYVRCREELLGSILDNMPVRDWRDFDIRMKWRLEQVEDGWASTYEESLAQHKRLEDDMRILRQAAEATLHPSKVDAVATATEGDNPSSGIHSGRSSTAGHVTGTGQRRSAVLKLLETSPELSDREIARRCGVSPQTVGSYRRSLAIASKVA
ncbi:hypothetical protein DEM27_12430 [Metarhizobium album]|uniref:Winged helix-turn-helix domain-containing protein n=1 Tax=Metarhizobium album TaxID=2182425 RepID=A0A2U2DSC2_9HYPH|nr:hypothetical protein [Rhizobium album]PWE56226.1 hypothetical protein DEM27_12430 [Rhizobium album]